MDKRLLTILVLLLSLTGCGEDTAAPNDLSSKTTASGTQINLNFTGGAETLTMYYPNWEVVGSDDPNNNLTLRGGVCTLALNIVDVPISWYREAVEEYVRNRSGTILSDIPLSYRIGDGRYTFETRTRGIVCDDKAHFILFTCPSDYFDEATANKVFNSIECQRNWSVPGRKNRRLGIVVTPQNASNLKSYYEAYNLARDNGVQMTHYYVSWKEYAKDKRSTDFIMETARNKGLKTSVVFDTIHSSVLGPLPDGFTFKGWEDPALVDGVISFVNEFLDRYGDNVEYIEIGNEVNIYFQLHPEELDGYKIFYKQVYNQVKEKHPDVMIGTVFAYHEMRWNDDYSTYTALSDIGDFDGFTIYIYSPGFIFDKPPSDILVYLNGIEELTKNRFYAIEELGWNAHPGLKGSDNDQREAVDMFFKYLENAPERLLFLTWFDLHDGTPENCREQAESFLEPDDPVLNESKFMNPFTDFICYLGLIKSDGTPRSGWLEFQKRANEYKN